MILLIIATLIFAFYQRVSLILDKQYTRDDECIRMLKIVFRIGNSSYRCVTKNSIENLGTAIIKIPFLFEFLSIAEVVRIKENTVYRALHKNVRVIRIHSGKKT